jgi:hypothetical protein
MIVAKPCLVALFSSEASTTKSAVNAIGATMFPQIPSIMPVRPVSLYAASMRKARRASRNPMPVSACSIIRRFAPALGRRNMTLFYSHHDRWHGSAGGFSAGRVLRRIRTALKTLHRAIAAAKIRRLRNELRLHAATRSNWARPHQLEPEAHGDRIPRQPLHFGEKWDF